MTRLRPVLATAAAGALVALTPTTASAATLELDPAAGISNRGSCQAYSSGGSYGDACFHEDGDYFYVTETAGGARVVAHWQVKLNGTVIRHGFIRWRHTAANTMGWKNKDVPEQAGERLFIRFGICAANSGCDQVTDLVYTGPWDDTPA